MTEFHSIFRDELQNYLAFREKALSMSGFAHYRCYLTSFDAYLTNCRLEKKNISETLVMKWVSTLIGKKSSIANKIIIIRNFLKYLLSDGIPVFLPKIPRVSDDYIPYIFSDEEIQRIFAAADNITVTKVQPNPRINIEFPTLLRLLYGCGLRVGETLSLQMMNVDLDGGILTMLHTKNEKQRLVPLSNSMIDILKCYCLVMGITGKPDAYLFPNAVFTGPMSVRSARNKFDVILRDTGITLDNFQWHQRGPCLHCLRHVFVFRSFAKTEKEGYPIDGSVPFLSTFLGHSSLNETDKYLKFSSDLYPEAVILFESYMSDVFPKVVYEDENL